MSIEGIIQEAFQGQNNKLIAARNWKLIALPLKGAKTEFGGAGVICGTEIQSEESRTHGRSLDVHMLMLAKGM